MPFMLREAPIDKCHQFPIVFSLNFHRQRNKHKPIHGQKLRVYILLSIPVYSHYIYIGL